MFIEYQNSLGNVIMSGSSDSEIRLTQTDGLGVAERQYTTAYFAEHDGQETLDSKALPRCITLGLEVCGRDIAQTLRKTLRILSKPGYLILGEKRIFCNQIRIPDPARILKGRIATLGVQFVCDKPFFEDAESTVCSIYQRTKDLTSPFTLPKVLGRTYSRTEVCNRGDIAAEPVIRIICPRDMEEGESITLSNLTTGKNIGLRFVVRAGEEILVDIPNRKIHGSLGGNMLNTLTDETFLNEFVLVPGMNQMSVVVGTLESGFVVECTFRNLYAEAVII